MEVQSYTLRVSSTRICEEIGKDQLYSMIWCWGGNDFNFIKVTMEKTTSVTSSW